MKSPVGDVQSIFLENGTTNNQSLLMGSESLILFLFFARGGIFSELRQVGYGGSAEAIGHRNRLIEP
jgi:hypothetical protein